MLWSEVVTGSVFVLSGHVYFIAQNTDFVYRQQSGDPSIRNGIAPEIFQLRVEDGWPEDNV
jgi:uncharacterized pyridoxamine 5'-phosphate oxidase family protein